MIDSLMLQINYPCNSVKYKISDKNRYSIMMKGIATTCKDIISISETPRKKYLIKLSFMLKFSNLIPNIGKVETIKKDIMMPDPNKK